MRIVRFVVGLALTASVARAATFLVGSDRDLIRSSAAVVVATAGESISIRSAQGTIETLTRMHAEEAIAGPIATGDDFDVTSLGGFVDGVGLMVPGAPRFAPGGRVLLCLEKDADARWTPKAMALGKFTFERDRLLRDSGEIFGWEYEGTPHAERERAAEPFLRFVRDTAAGGNPAADYFVPKRPLNRTTNEVTTNATPTIGSYLIQQGGTGIRWNSFPATTVFLSNGTQPGASNGGITAAQRGLNVWTSDSGSNIAYQYGGTTSSKGGLANSDGINSILFNDPSNEIAGAFTGLGGDVLAIGGAWYGSATHTFRGEMFFTIQEADLVVQNGITGPGLTGNGLDHVLAHELGHTLGFRHSDHDPTDQACNPSTMSCSSVALMNSTVNFNNDPTGAALQAWDREAAAAVYGSAAICTPPSITAQPQPATLAGAPVALAVTAAGSLPLSYQWYAGSRGDTSHPAAGGNGPVVTLQPASTTSYWVRVTGPCTPPADSDAAIVTVNGCPGVFITALSGTASIIQGKTTPLSISISAGGRPVTIQWYGGARGDTSHPVSGGNAATVNITPPSTQTYWAQVTNDCGASATSDVVTITVTPCTAPSVVIQPASSDVVSGFPATLYAAVSGTQPMQFQWFEGTPPDTSRTLTGAATASVATAPLFASAKFWLRATNDCGIASTAIASINVVSACTPPAIVQPADQFVVAGATAVITVLASGPSLTFAWYQGPVLDFTHPVGGNGPSLLTPPITQLSQFWVRITNPCTSGVNSAVIKVTPGGRRRAAGR